MPGSALTSCALADILEREIVELASGTRIEAEHALARRFDVTRGMVRGALAELESKYLLRRVRGSGTFVSRRLEVRMSGNEPPSFHSVIEASGATLRTRLVGARESPAPEDVAAALGIEPGRALRCLTRLGSVDDLSFSCAEEWLAPGVAQDIDAGLGVIESVNEILAAYGHRPQRALSLVTVEHPSQEVAHHLGLAEPIPVWLLETVTSDESDSRTLMVSRTWMRLDTVRLVIAVGASQTLRSAV